MTTSSDNKLGCGGALLILVVLAVGFCCVCVLPIGMIGSYYDRRALAEADQEWASGNRAVAVEKYRPLLKNSVFDDADKKRIAERVTEFEAGRTAAETPPAVSPPPVDLVTRLDRKRSAVERVLAKARTDQEQIAQELRKLNIRTAADLGTSRRGQELAKRLPGLVAEVEWIEGKIAELDGAILDEKRYARQAELQQAGLTPAEQTERAERIKRLEEDAGVPPTALTPLDLEAAVAKTLGPPPKALAPPQIKLAPSPTEPSVPPSRGTLSRPNLIFEAVGAEDRFFASVAVSPNGRLLASGTFSRVVELWDMSTHQLSRHVTQMSGKVHALAFSPDSGRLAVACGGKSPTIRVFKVDDRGVSLQREMTGHKGGPDDGGVWSVSFDSTGRRLASGGADGLIGVWDVATGKLIGQSKSSFGPVFGVKFLPDDAGILVCGKNKAVHLYETSTARLVRKFVGHDADVWSISVSADGKRLLTGDLNAGVCAWEVGTGRMLQRFTAPNRGVFAVALTPDGRYALAGGGTAFLGTDKPEPGIACWEIDTGRLVRRFDGHRDTVWGIAAWPDGRGFVSCDVNRRLRWWLLPD